MNNSLILGIVISIVYFILKFIDSKYIQKDDKPLKENLKDSIIVFLAIIMVQFIFDQFNVNEIIGNTKKSLSAFTNNPDF